MQNRKPTSRGLRAQRLAAMYRSEARVGVTVASPDGSRTNNLTLAAAARLITSQYPGVSLTSAAKLAAPFVAPVLEEAITVVGDAIRAHDWVKHTGPNFETPAGTTTLWRCTRCEILRKIRVGSACRP